MNRFGWFLLGIFLLVGAGFILLLREGEKHEPSPAPRAMQLPAGTFTIPVVGVSPDRLVPTFDDQREGGSRGHEAIDIPAPRGTAVIAAAAGRVERLFDSERGGHTIYVRSPDRRWMHYYAHLDRYEPGLAEGSIVARGQLLGRVGYSGNADPAAPHLHYALWRMDPAAPWYRPGTPVDPYALFMSQAPSRRR